MLHYESPFRFHPRTAARQAELGGTHIPQGALILLLWAAANRDPAVFERPDEVVIERPNSQPIELGLAGMSDRSHSGSEGGGQDSIQLIQEDSTRL
ncbi:MAG TPA: cytochrome P450 [Acidimicrobiales bacterium]|nr:cytochrome P450 [Acidimicrobiales bacterium]